MFSEIQEEISISENTLPDSLESKLIEQDFFIKSENLMDVFFDSFERLNLECMKNDLTLQKKLSIINEVEQDKEQSNQPIKKICFQLEQDDGQRYIKSLKKQFTSTKFTNELKNIQKQVQQKINHNPEQVKEV